MSAVQHEPVPLAGSRMTSTPRGEIDALLDRIDPARYDVDDVVRRLNDYEALDPEEQDEHYEYGGALDYAGVEAHPLTAFCGDAHNEFFVLRDLDGSLRFVWEDPPPTQRWDAGPLFGGHLLEEQLEPYLLGEQPLADLDIPLSVVEFRMVVAALPNDPPGSLYRF